MRVSVNIHSTEGEYRVVMYLWQEMKLVGQKQLATFSTFHQAMQYKQECLEGKQAEQGVYHLEGAS